MVFPHGLIIGHTGYEKGSLVRAGWMGRALWHETATRKSGDVELRA